MILIKNIMFRKKDIWRVEKKDKTIKVFCLEPTLSDRDSLEFDTEEEAQEVLLRILSEMNDK